MCGIVGQYNPRGANVSAIEKAAQLLTYRGPDDSGSFGTGPIAFGFRRLAILDVSPAGHQPMRSADGHVTIIFNGEIYNYLELRQELSALGVKFSTGTDTEVILAAYQHWGQDCFARFNGMWALAIWDHQRGELILSRDRFGEKPLYYVPAAGGYFFASEIKALLSLINTTPAPNEQIVFDYLVYAFHDHTDQTFFQGIKQLQPGHVAVMNQQGLTIKAYWTLQPLPAFRGTAKQAAEHFQQLFTDSVRLRLRSDVPLGSCLSGGLDSSTIVMVVNQLLGQDQGRHRQKTFTACADNPRYDERVYSRLVNELIGAEQNEITPQADDFLHDFSDLLWHQEEPFLSLSIFAQWQVMRRVRERNVTVVLDGQGGDEILAGYIPFFASFFAQRLRQADLVGFVQEMRGFLRLHQASLMDILPTFALYALPRSIGSFMLRYSRRPEVRSLHNNFRKSFFHYPDLPQPFDSQLKNHLYRLLTGTGLRALLHYEDRNAMAFSVESRTPFLDHRLAEFTLSLPDHFLMSQGQTKLLLRRAFSKLLPPTIRDRHEKMGFVVPQTEWLQGPLAKDVRTSLTSPTASIRRFIEPDALGQVTNRFFAGQNALQPIIWRWYNLEKWLDRFYG